MTEPTTEEWVKKFGEWQERADELDTILQSMYVFGLCFTNAFASSLGKKNTRRKVAACLKLGPSKEKEAKEKTGLTKVKEEEKDANDWYKKDLGWKSK